MNMQEDPVKICSKCGEEYSLEAQVCAECGGRLVFEQEYEKRFVPLDETEQMICVREDTAAYLQELGELLKKNGLRTFIKLHHGVPGAKSCRTRYGLYVAPEDEVAAREIIKKHWLKDAPEQASAFEYEEQELKGICPACSTAIPEDSAECPECGLVVKADEEVFVCPTCDGEVGEQDKTCPHCGEKFV
jgi:predicted amidophosphoribosyltransferase